MRYYLADSEGRMCERSSIDTETACCTSGTQFSCETCENDACCERYEDCVSCCLAPKNDASNHYLTEYRSHFSHAVHRQRHCSVYRIRGREDTGKWPNVFQYCQGICRTWRHSTTHENAFIDTRRYCYSAYGRPTVSHLANLRLTHVASLGTGDCRTAGAIGWRRHRCRGSGGELR